MKSLAMFNNKGGVGKTTLTCNLASYIALEFNKRILVVDCDPQCNSTQLIMGVEEAPSCTWKNLVRSLRYVTCSGPLKMEIQRLTSTSPFFQLIVIGSTWTCWPDIHISPSSKTG